MITVYASDYLYQNEQLTQIILQLMICETEF